MRNPIYNKAGNLRKTKASFKLSNEEEWVENLPLTGWVVSLDKGYGFNFNFHDPESSLQIEFTVPSETLFQIWSKVDDTEIEAVVKRREAIDW